jgi:hypothetical protein
MSTKEKQLLAAVKQQSTAKIHALLSAGANPNAPELSDINNPLFAICNFVVNMHIVPKTAEIVEILLNAGANPDATFSPLNFSLLALAASGTKDTELTGMLLGKGAKPNAVSADGKTVLIHAIYKNRNFNNIKMLLDAGADPAMPDSKGKLPIHYVCDKRLEDETHGDRLIELFKEKGVAVDPHYVPSIRTPAPFETPKGQARLSLISARDLRKQSPKICFNPIQGEMDIVENLTVFYMKKPDGIYESFCMIDQELNYYKTHIGGLFYRCRPEIPESAKMILETSVYTNKDEKKLDAIKKLGSDAEKAAEYGKKVLRRLDFTQRIYVFNEQAKALEAGMSYVLEPFEPHIPVGRLASHSILGGASSIVGALHCQDDEPGIIFSIRQIGDYQTRPAKSKPGSSNGAGGAAAAGSVGGRRRTRRSRRARRTRRSRRTKNRK